MIKKVKRRAPSPPFSSPPPPPSQPQEPAALNIEQISPFVPLPPPPPPPEFPPTLQTTEGSGGNLAHDPPLPPTPPPQSSVLPVLKKEGDGVLGAEISRGVKLRKKEKQSCELYIDVPRQSLLKQIQQGVKLKPVSCC